MVMDKREMIKQFAQIGKDFHRTQQEILIEHPYINALKDARATVFTNCYVVVDSIYVCLVVRSYELFEAEWWSKLRHENKIAGGPTNEALPVFVKGFDSFTITAYFNLSFIAIENSFRAFHKAIRPSKDVPRNYGLM
jgi:hypothetical protein